MKTDFENKNLEKEAIYKKYFEKKKGLDLASIKTDKIVLFVSRASYV
jgi:hypothetical protein